MMTEQKPEGGLIGEGSQELATAGNTGGVWNEGRMELSSVKTLLDNISCFGLLSSSSTIKAEVVHRFCRTIDEILMLLKPVLEDAVLSEIVPNEKLMEVLKELDDLVNEARELLGSWHQMMSIIYIVLQIEPMINRIQGLAVVSYQQLQLLYPSLFTEDVESFTKKIQQVHHEKILDKLKEAINDQINKRIPRSDHLEKISDFLSLSSNQELLMEAVALDKLKSKVGRSESHIELEYIDLILALIIYMHDCLVKAKQLHSTNGVPIPPDFCCPLSLELMSDPVIVASGQTYERAFIKKWLDLGFNVCPKTRQTLGHNNLIPNYTVKALIENWCESNNIKLPDPIRSLNQNLPSVFISSKDKKAINDQISSYGNHLERNKYNRSPEKNTSSVNVHKYLASSNGTHQESYLLEKPSSSQHHVSDVNSRDSPFMDSNDCDREFARISISGSENKNESRSEQKYACSCETSPHSKEDLSQFGQLQGNFYSNPTSNAVLGNENHEIGDARTASQVHSDLTTTSSDVSGEVLQETPISSTQVEQELISKFSDVRLRSQTFWRRPSDRFSQKIISSLSLDSKSDASGVEAQVRKLVEDLKTDSVDVQRATTEELRLLAKHNMENRIVIANCGAIPLLVGLLHSKDPKTQENAVTALLNLSINDNNKTAIANADAIDPLIHVLETGNHEAKENSAATLFSLSVIEENKVRIGRSGAIKPLVDLLGNGTRRGKKDAATALFNLSIFHENKARIVQAGAVRYLIELMDPAAGMVDKAVAVLANLATIPEGRTAIGHEGGIPVLVEVVELGSARGKENAAAALLQLCTNSNRFCSLVLQEGAVPPLVALSQSGTARAKEKAQALLSYFRNQRHGNAGRA